MTNQKRDFQRSAKHRRSTADASPSSSEQRRSGDKSPYHRQYYHVEYAPPMFTRTSPMCRCSAIYRRWYLASKHREKIAMHAICFSRCVHRGSIVRLEKPCVFAGYVYKCIILYCFYYYYYPSYYYYYSYIFNYCFLSKVASTIATYGFSGGLLIYTINQNM